MAFSRSHSYEAEDSGRGRGGVGRGGETADKLISQSVSPSPQGILPSKKSSKDFVTRDDYRYRFLAGNREVLKGCGVWMIRGCLESEKHGRNHVKGQVDLDGIKVVGKDVVEFYRASCGRLACPICYEKACGKEAIRIEHRMMSFKIHGRDLKAIHVVVSPSEKDVVILSYEGLKSKAYVVAKACGVFGGSMIFHPFRRYNEEDLKEDLEAGFDWKTAPACWYISPHFHIIGYGWVKRVKECYETSGWVVKNLGVRKSIRATAHYQLSHCGIRENERCHAVTWFGALAYNKMRCSPLPKEKHLCPLCGEEMGEVKFVDPEDELLVISILHDEGIWVVDHGVFCYADDLNTVGNGG